MTTPTEILSREHRMIEQGLEVLDVLATQGEKGELDVACAKDLMHFIRRYGDTCHHGKEEDLLFPHLESRGFAPDAGPTAVMRGEHDEGRAHVRHMTAMLAESPVTASERQLSFARHARLFTSMLRHHIVKEDTCLWSMVNAVLTQEDATTLVEAMEAYESDEFPDGEIEQLESLVVGLRRRVGLAPRSVEDPAARNPMEV